MALFVSARNQKHKDAKSLHCKIRSVYFVTVSDKSQHISPSSPASAVTAGWAAGAGVAWPVAAGAREAESSEGSHRQSVGSAETS